MRLSCRTQICDLIMQFHAKGPFRAGVLTAEALDSMKGSLTGVGDLFTPEWMLWFGRLISLQLL